MLAFSAPAAVAGALRSDRRAPLLARRPPAPSPRRAARTRMTAVDPASFPPVFTPESRTLLDEVDIRCVTDDAGEGEDPDHDLGAVAAAAATTAAAAALRDADSDRSPQAPAAALFAATLTSNDRAVGVSFGSHRMKVFSGSSNPGLAADIARYVGKPDTSAILRKRFSDGESYVKIEESVRGCNVFLVQATSDPANDNLIELLIMIDACRRAHAHQITAVIPYYGYARADRLIDPDKRRREALTSKLVANMLCAAGTDRVVVLDIHSPQTCGFFDIPVDHIFAGPLLTDYINKKNLDDLVIVAPDVGGVARARAFASGAGGAPLAIIDKRREAHNQSKVLNLVGDVKGKTAVLVDDMIDTAGTICNAAKMLRERGARQVLAVATHPILSGPAVERLSSGVFEEVIVCDTINVPLERRFPQLTILSVSAIIGEQIWRVHEQSSR
jgi:ribose-phosphate pyrophosphokinase